MTVQILALPSRQRSGNKLFNWTVDRATLAALPPGELLKKRLSLVASACVAIIIGIALRDTDWKTLWPALTASGLFWGVFTLNYLHAPLADAAIFARAWGARPGLFTTLIRKQVLNALVVPYAGEALLLDWARRREIRAFSVVKDAAILSALAGSVATFALVLPVWGPLSIALDLQPSSLLGSIGLLSAVPFVALVKRRAVFGLPGRELVRIGAVHATRVFVNVALLAECWHLLLPTASLQSWLLLAAARMVVSRLPLIPNKEIALAGVALAMFPEDHAVVGVIAVTGVMLTAAHALAWTVLALRDLTQPTEGTA